MVKRERTDEGGTGFEDDLKRLEEIVKALEDGDLPLDDAVALFKEGITLTKRCSKKLDEAEARIEKLVEEKGKIERKRFDGD